MPNETIMSRQMRSLEINSEYFGVSRLILMENAGHSVASEIATRFKNDKSVAVFCGLGGNGGDGFVIARHLTAKGFEVEIILAGRSKDISDDAAAVNWKALQFLSETVTAHEIHDSALIPDVKADILVDALLGTGTKGKLRPPILQIVRKINAAKAVRIAVDVPTGVDADTGDVLGVAVKADLTVTFHRAKKGFRNAGKYVGEVIVKDIGLPKYFERCAGPGDVMIVTKPRPSKAHKGDFGRLLVVGGSETFSGAPTLVAMAALRCGVDLAYVAAPEKTAQAISSLSPDLITVKLAGSHLNLSNVSDLKEHIETCTAVAMGPGLGLHDETCKAAEAIVDAVERANKPLLLDADGLKAFADFKRKLNVPLVLTPHAGEYAILTGRKLSDSLPQRITEVNKMAAHLNAVILLKGAGDIISDGRHTKLNFSGNPGMTVGGTGDVLSGIVGAFLAQRNDPYESAVAGAFVNGAAGDFVFHEKGAHIVASDLIDWIPRVLNDPMSHIKVQGTRAE